MIKANSFNNPSHLRINEYGIFLDGKLVKMLSELDLKVYQLLHKNKQEYLALSLIGGNFTELIKAVSEDVFIKIKQSWFRSHMTNERIEINYMCDAIIIKLNLLSIIIKNNTVTLKGDRYEVS